eukprot:203894-Lingulodinium_polyedra.AAC.1
MNARTGKHDLILCFMLCVCCRLAHEIDASVLPLYAMLRANNKIHDMSERAKHVFSISLLTIAVVIVVAVVVVVSRAWNR